MIQTDEIMLELVDSTRKVIIVNLWQYYELESSFYTRTDVGISGRKISIGSFKEEK